MPRPGRRIRGRKRERAEEDRVGAGGDRVARRRGSSMPLDQKGAGQDPGHSSRLARACRLDDGACDQRPEFAASTVPTRAPHLKRANVDHGADTGTQPRVPCRQEAGPATGSWCRSDRGEWHACEAWRGCHVVWPPRVGSGPCASCPNSVRVAQTARRRQGPKEALEAPPAGDVAGAGRQRGRASETARYRYIYLAMYRCARDESEGFGLVWPIRRDYGAPRSRLSDEQATGRQIAKELCSAAGDQGRPTRRRDR